MTWYFNGMVVVRPRVVASLVALGLGFAGTACGSRADERRDEPPPNEPAPAPPDDEPDRAAEVPRPSEFPKEARSLELVRTIGVRLQPGDDAKPIGTIAVDTRVAWGRTAKAKGCQKSWIEIQPRGWICADYVRPSMKPPHGREVPALGRGEIVPGIYGKVTAPNSVTYTVEKSKTEKRREKTDKRRAARSSGPITSPRQLADADDAVTTAPKGPLKLIEGKPLVGSVNVRQYDEITSGGRTYWKIAPREQEYVLRQAITQHRPSSYAGTRLGDETGWEGPIAFVWSRWGGAAHAMYHPTGSGGVNPTPIPARTPVQILETHTDKSGAPLAYRIGELRWLHARDVRLFRAVPPPAHLRPGERWIDIDLDSQILVAYEGDMPVYATMMSSGSSQTPTETGEYRMWMKKSETDMKGLNGEDPYSVATVPWAQFFSADKGLALHTAYWHDGFGVKRSHGCINLAPHDARWLYFWSDPQVPPGWTMAAGVVEAPGSIVRVRTKDEPNPPPREYAKKVLEARQQNAPVR